MSKAAAIAIGLAVIFVQVCCMPSLEAALPDKPLYCPITGVKCQASDVEKCDGEKPVLSSPVAPHAMTPALIAIDVVSAAAAPPAETPAVFTYWSASTRTIQLRI